PRPMARCSRSCRPRSKSRVIWQQRSRSVRSLRIIAMSSLHSEPRRGFARMLDTRVTRRGFLGTLTVPMLAAACGRRPYDPKEFQHPSRSDVALLPADSYSADFSDVIGRGLRELGVDVRGKRVLLKPNMVEYEPGTAINTNPLVIA